MARIDQAQAIERLKRGEVVALPTETVYGLAGRIDHEDALKAIFSTKQRPFFDPLIVHVKDVSSVRGLVSEWPAVFSVLADKFWPGPLTLIAPKTPAVSSLICSGLETVALRCPDHPLTLQVLRALNVPLAAPSANRFGRTSPTTAAHVESEFGGQVPVLDGGPCRVGVESTVVAVEDDQLRVLRPGGVSREQLRRALAGAGLRFTIARAESVASPGHLKAHYQPVSPVILLENQVWSPEIARWAEKQLGRKIKGAQELRLAATPQEAARKLYEDLRQNSSDADHVIWIARKPAQHVEDWEAIWDRVERAATILFAGFN